MGSGELRLPAMQRRYVWQSTRVRDLLDSLYRGYPSGNILVWETQQDVPTRDAAISQSSSPFKTTKLLLDGQQRLTSLSAVMRGEPVKVRRSKKPVEILFNLDHPDGPPVELLEVEGDEETPFEADDDADDEDDGTSVLAKMNQRAFVVSSSALLSQPNWIKVTDIFKDDKTEWELLESRLDSPKDPRYKEWSKRIQKVRKIRDYTYDMHILKSDLDYLEVAEIFVRVNSLGAKLRGSDLAMAQITSRWPESLELMEGFQAGLEEQTWFTVDLGLVVRTLVVFATKQCRFKTAGSIPVDKLRKAWAQVERGLTFAANFLRQNAGIEDESLLTSPLFLIPLAVMHEERKGQLKKGEEKALLYWLLMANTKGHYSRGSSETILDQDLSAIYNGSGVDAMLQLLERQVGRMEVQVDDIVGKGQRSSLFSMAYLALKARGAKDWNNGLEISLTHTGRYHYIQFHHIFPKSLLNKAGYEKAEVNEIANMAFVSGETNRRISNKEPIDYLTKLVDKRGPDDLESQCIPTDAKYWEMDNYSKFLEFRRKALVEIIGKYLASKRP
jgi:hypothetical protein